MNTATVLVVWFVHECALTLTLLAIGMYLLRSRDMHDALIEIALRAQDVFFVAVLTIYPIVATIVHFLILPRT